MKEKSCREAAILYSSKPHFVVLVRALLSIFFAIFSFISSIIFVKLLALMFLWFMFKAVAKFLGDGYYIYSHKVVVVKQGLFYHSLQEIYLAQIEGVSVSQSFRGMIFNYGAIDIKRIGEKEVNLEDVSDPIAFKERLLEVLDLSRRREQFRG